MHWLNETGSQGYHPVSLVLNCENYYYADYASGADILLQASLRVCVCSAQSHLTISQDTYMIGNNVTWSSQWNTTCTPDYGDCGCDNCKVCTSLHVCSILNLKNVRIGQLHRHLYSHGRVRAARHCAWLGLDEVLVDGSAGLRAGYVSATTYTSAVRALTPSQILAAVSHRPGVACPGGHSD
jgi:hypothetical protein